MDNLLEGIDVDYLARCDFAKTGLTWSAFLTSERLLDAVRALYGAGYFLEDLTAIDAKEGFLVVYHFDHMDHQPGRVALRVLIPHDKAEIPSIASVFQGAEWHERETTDFYGITFVGNPNPVPLLLPADLKLHPLLKSEAQRAALADMVPPGEEVRRATGFTLFAPPAATEGGDQAPTA